MEAEKKKHQKWKTEENLNFPGSEQIKFGDVQIPRKLVVVPKVAQVLSDIYRTVY